MKRFAKILFNREGSENHIKSRCYLHKFLNITKNLIKKIIEELKRESSDLRVLVPPAGASCIARVLQNTVISIKKIIAIKKRKLLDRSALIPPAGASCRGAILVEFAVCMPILIISLFYINDLMKIKRFYSQTEFVAQQAANILQNLAKKKAANGKNIGFEDLSHAASLAFLSMYPGKTMYSIVSGQNKYEFFHKPFFIIYYVEGTSGEKAKCVWGKAIATGDNKGKPPWGNFMNITNNQSWSIVTYTTNEVTPSSIYSLLKVDNGMPKIILETALWWAPANMDRNEKKVDTAREAFGFRFVNPKRHVDLYFNSVVMFSPSAGFPKTRPDT